MLQQTRVATVLPYYERFLAAFPTVRDLSRAKEERVLGLWSGLGYYTRARNLRRAASEIVHRHGGEFPSDPESLRRLPGVGPYTQGAILSLAFDRPYPVVDGNVARVLARWFRLAEDVKSPAGSRVVWNLAAALLPEDSPGEFNQALMELGARICRPRGPLCGACPVAPVCRAHAAGSPESYPILRKRPRPIRIEGVAVLVESGGRTLLVRRGQGENRGLLDVPSVEAPAASTSAAAVRALRLELSRLGIQVDGFRELAPIRHAVMTKDYRLRLFGTGLVTQDRAGSGRRANGGPGTDSRWLSPSEWTSAALTARAKKALAVLAAEASPRQRRAAGGRKKMVRKSSVRRKPARS